MSSLRTPVLILTLAAASACSAVTPPPRFSRVSPADENAPEASGPPPVAVLSEQPEVVDARATKEPAPPGDPHAGHGGHGQSSTPVQGSVMAYTCPHHPEVQAPAPGSCPKCGTRMVRKPAPEPRP